MKWLLQFVIPSLMVLAVSSAEQGAFSNNKSYDQGEYGNFVAQQYHSTSIKAPRPNVYEKAGSCPDDGLLVMLSLRGFAVPQAGPMILDSRGSLVWMDANYVQPYNLQVQTYRDEQFLTFWAGDDGVKGHGSGLYYMLDSHYTLRYTLTGGNNLDGDLHEFYLTPNGTALITIYHIVPANLTSVDKPADGWIWDGIFQEIDIETNQVLFSWAASEHLPFTDSQWRPDNLGFTKDSAWDWFHMNSVEKDPKGNYLISSRWMHAIYYIDGGSGQILWTLGGRSNDFEDLSHGRAISFASQHHARWHDKYSSITLFDNSNPGPGQPSSGMWLDLDFENWTVRLRTQYLSKLRMSSSSQGSMQTLPSGNVLVGYGADAQYVEFTRAGDIVCEVRLMPSSQFGTGAAQSYRVAKHAWVGLPLTEPDIVQQNGVIYVSWNGATEVRYWMVEDGTFENATHTDFREAFRVPKEGFETMVFTLGIQREYVRVAGLDLSGNVLGRSRTVLRGKPTGPPDGETEERDEELLSLKRAQKKLKRLVVVSSTLAGASMLSLLISAGIGAWHLRKYYHYDRVSDGEQKELTIFNPELDTDKP
ncbi:uncharacterized protein PV06_01197 [Exophiala oligosperma]|uniref:ASST-domain-containing protein n=1 Tax=Exophiala oligosperma TaxID=215243 RepID=A0A0D2CFH4_9EURO|nr:uncharacterized protein PV06_01197 [Exophiala oligosperma]KIW48627.1 hypothetical protein PV06_01197 [Exophiala oligosperma]